MSLATINPSIHAKVMKAARKVAGSWPIEHNGRPAVVRGKTIESAILESMGFGRDTGGKPVVSESLQKLLKAVGTGAVKHAWGLH